MKAMVDLSYMGAYIKKSLAEDIDRWEIKNSELTIYVKSAVLVKVISFLRDDNRCLYNQLMDICGVDYPERTCRFEVIYHLLSLQYNQRVRVVVCTDERMSVPTVIGLFDCADWWEREVWDMFGITFKDHPDLRRILTDYNFEGHPLRKDFPVMGYQEVRYDDHKKKVVYEPVKLEQEFRSFDFISPWESMTTEIKKHLNDSNSNTSSVIERLDE